MSGAPVPSNAQSGQTTYLHVLVPVVGVCYGVNATGHFKTSQPGSNQNLRPFQQSAP